MNALIPTEMASLQEEVELLSGMLNNCSDLIHRVTPEGKFLFVNDAWRNALGYTEEEISQLSLMDIVDNECRQECLYIFNAMIKGEEVPPNQTVFIARNGRRITVEGQCRTTFANGRAVAMTGIFRDITDRIKNVLALNESEQRFRSLFENSTDIMQIVAPDGHFLHVNPAWLRTFGYTRDEVNSLTIFDLISPDCQDHCQNTFQQVLSEDRVHQIDTIFIGKGNNRVDIEGNAIAIFKEGKPIYSQCIFRDVTEKRKMEEELLKAQKLESIGVFAGGLAHDFNNLLTAIIGNISLAQVTVADNIPLMQRFKKIEKAARRAKGLTQQLLTFAKGGAPIKKLAGITELVKESTDFSLRGSGVRQKYQFETNLWPAEVDGDQLSQVIQNLAINALQAMPDGGMLTIAGKNITIETDNSIGLEPGQYLLLTVADEGHGISRQDQEKIFDPYFSLKKGGSGLGLAVAYAIMKKHNGLITVDSLPGMGTTFSLFLPATDVRLEEGTENELQQEKKSVGGNILIMDDEEIVREVAGEMLKFLGYTTCCAEHGEQAVQLYQEAMKNGFPFDAVLMDLTIPGGMGGKETMIRLLEIDPRAKGIASSGYANDPIMAHFVDYGFSGVVPKPYQMDELQTAMTDVIAAHN